MTLILVIIELSFSLREVETPLRRTHRPRSRLMSLFLISHLGDI